MILTFFPKSSFLDIKCAIDMFSSLFYNFCCIVTMMYMVYYNNLQTLF